MKSVRRLEGRITLRCCAGHEWRYLFVKLLHNQAIERLASMQSPNPDNFRAWSKYQISYYLSERFLISGCCTNVLRSNQECREWKRLLRQSETIWYMRLFPHKQSQLRPIRIMENCHDKSGFLKTSTSSFRATFPGKERIVSLGGGAMPNHMLPRLESEVLDCLSKQESW